MGIALPLAMVSLYGLSLCISFPWHQSNGGKESRTPRNREKRRLVHAIDFIFATILLQCKIELIKTVERKDWTQFNSFSAGPTKTGIGNKNQRKSLVIRVMTGAWCLSCFVLITAYCSVLVSFLTEPEKLNKPIIDSIDDLIKRPEIRVTVKKGWGPDFLFQVFYFKINSLIYRNDVQLIWTLYRK